MDTTSESDSKGIIRSCVLPTLYGTVAVFLVVLVIATVAEKWSVITGFVFASLTLSMASFPIIIAAIYFQAFLIISLLCIAGGRHEEQVKTWAKAVMVVVWLLFYGISMGALTLTADFEAISTFQKIFYISSFAPMVVAAFIFLMLLSFAGV